MKLTEILLQFFFPQECGICSREDSLSRIAGICKPCHKKSIPQFFPIHENRCQVCQNPLQNDSVCEFCNSRNVFFQNSFVIRPRLTIQKQLMNRLKFANEEIYSRYFAMGLGRILPKLRELGIDAIVAVPSHSASLRNRPFPSAKLLAYRLKKKLGVPVLSVIQKVSSTHQSALSRKERFFHARKAFYFKKNSFPITNLTLLLIDDVFTTGSSVNEVSRILLEHGAKSVNLLVSSRSLEGIEI